MEMVAHFTQDDIKELINEYIEKKQGFLTTGKFNWIYDNDGDLLRVECNVFKNE